jgi:cytoskeletal protein CcmA (bactofilin family)
MLKVFKSKTDREREQGVSAGLPQGQPEKFRRLEDRVDANESVISAQCSFKGDLSGPAGAHILGDFNGNIHSEGLVRSGKTAKIKGNIHSPYVIIEGELEGNIFSARQVEIRSSARMRGNIETEMLAIADGSFFEGQVRMANPESKPVRFTERRNPESG